MRDQVVPRQHRRLFRTIAVPLVLEKEPLLHCLEPLLEAEFQAIHALAGWLSLATGLVGCGV